LPHRGRKHEIFREFELKMFDHGAFCMDAVFDVDAARACRTVGASMKFSASLI